MVKLSHNVGLPVEPDDLELGFSGYVSTENIRVGKPGGPVRPLVRLGTAEDIVGDRAFQRWVNLVDSNDAPNGPHIGYLTRVHGKPGGWIATTNDGRHYGPVATRQDALAWLLEEYDAPPAEPVL